MTYTIFTTIVALAFLASASALERIDLGTSADFAVLTKAGVTTTGVTSITGDMGTSPIAATALTGFALILDSTTTFSTSSAVTGQIFAASYTSPTPSKMTTAISDMQTAHVDGSGRPDPDFIDFEGGLVEGQTLTAGLYKWSGDVMFTSSLTFSGSSTQIWILQIAGNVVAGPGAGVILEGGAKAENIFWVVSGKVVCMTTSHMEGVILSKTNIVFQTGSSLNGAALAQTAVTLDATTIVQESA